MTLITYINLYKFLAYRMNAESNQGIQIILIESELLLLFLFSKRSGAGKKIISNNFCFNKTN